MEHDAKSQALLYVSDLATDDVDVFSYPRGKLVGTLTGFDYPAGECVDRLGDVFIAQKQTFYPSQTPSIFEFAHGGTSPIAVLSDPAEQPVGCSVDPATGNLAVANLDSTSYGQGSVSIFVKAKGSPQTFFDPELRYVKFCGYDDKGNLFVDGFDSKNAFQFAELPRGSNTYRNIRLDKKIGYAGAVQWDGKYVAVGDQDVNAIYRFKIPGSKGTLIGTTMLGGAQDVIQFWIQGSRVIGADYSAHQTEIYGYPAGGAPAKIINGPNTPYPYGATVSPKGSPSGASQRPLAQTGSFIYLADQEASQVLVYPAFRRNPKPIGTISQGVSGPGLITIDKSGTLYVPNAGNDTVTEYPAGQTTPSVTLTDGVTNPVATAVDPSGNLWVCNGSNVVEFPPGGTSPVKTIANGISNAAGLAFDSHGNLFVADVGNGTSQPAVIAVFRPGAKRPSITFGSGTLGYPNGLATDSAGDVYAGDYVAGEVFVFAKNRKTYKLIRTISPKVIAGPVTITTNDRLYIGATGGSDSAGVVEFAKLGRVGPLRDRIQNGFKSVFGLAADPTTQP